MTAPQQVQALIDEGRRCRAAGDRQASLRAFQRAIELDPASAVAHAECGYDHMHLSEIPQARAAFKRCLALDPADRAALIGLGHTFRHTGDFADAEQSFRRVLELEPGHAGASEGLGYTLRSLGRNDEALEALRTAATTNPAETRPKIEAVNLLRELGRPGEAVVLLRDIVAKQPDSKAHLLNLARLLKQTGDAVEGMELLRRAAAIDPDDLNLRIELGHALRDNHRFEEAQDVLTRVLEATPLNTSALNALGWTYRAAGSPEPAADCFERIVELDPANAGAHHALGLLARQRGEHEAALDRFVRAIELDPKSLSVRIERGHSLHHLGRYEDAAQGFAEILREWPGSRDAHLGLGYALRAAGNLDEALLAFDDASADDAAHPNGAIEAGHLLLRLDRPDEAEQRFRLALQRTPASEAALIGLGHALRRLGRAGEAETALREAIGARPDHDGARLALANMLQARHRLDEAAELMLEVIARRPGHADGLAALGHLRRRQGRRDEALALFTELLTHQPGHVQAMVEAAAEQRALGRPDLARQWLERALDGAAGDHLGALLALGELEMQGNDADAALQIYRRAVAAHPNDPWAWLGLARAQFAAGARDEALRTIAQAREWLGELPEIAGVEAELLRQMRDWTGALHVLDRALDGAAAPHFWLWLQKVQVLILTGDHGGAAALLAEAPASDPASMAHAALASGQLAEAEFRHQDAIAFCRRAAELDPGNPWAHYQLARAALLRLELGLSREALGAFARINRSALLLRGDSLGAMQNHVGQIVEEALLDDQALAALRAIGPCPEPAQFGELRRLIRDYPDYTPAALIAAIALRRDGQFDRRCPGNAALAPAIPRHIVQFWNVAPPEDVGALMASWRDRNPGHRWACFDDGQARDFIAAQFGRDIVHGYELAKLATQRADIFRLAVLVARGGVYADADSRCVVPLDNFVDAGATLVMAQDHDGSFGGGLIAASPEHPVLVRALELAAAAMKHGDLDLAWLATGPGLLTRALMQQWAADGATGLLQRTQVMDLGALQRMVGINCPVGERPDSVHWRKPERAKQRAAGEAAA